jgi:hypothetical protein
MARVIALGKYAFFLPLLGLILALGGCGGGGSGSSVDLAGSNYGGDPTFFLQELFFGRPLFDPNGNVYQVINPASIIESDPITGLLKDGYPQPLYPGESLGELGSFNLGESASSQYKVKIIPRNAAIVMDFSKSLDPDSLKLDNELHLTGESPIQILTESGAFVTVQALLLGDRVTLNPVTGGKIGLPPSPLLFDSNGNPIGTPTGYLRLVVYSAGTGKNVVQAADGQALSARGDLLGSPTKPVGFNPGNSRLDFINYGEVSFNGFLPDLSPPRIIRGHDDTGTASAGSTQMILVDDTKDFVAADQSIGYLGEWAGALLTLFPDDPSKKESVEVEWNEKQALHLKKGFVMNMPDVGDAYLLQRAEFFEPIPGLDPATSVDPINNPKDPFDPQDELNSDLYNFVILEEWDETNKVWGPPAGGYDPGINGSNPIDPNWRISLRFSEPMSLEAFKPFETFYVTDAAVSIEDSGFDRMKPGRATAGEDNRIISFEPVVTDQNEMGGDRLIGFGGEPKALRLVIRVVPPKKSIEDFYNSLGNPSNWPPEVVPDLEKVGVLGVNDLGGQPLGLPTQFLDKGSSYSVLDPDSPARGAFIPAVDLKYEFNTRELFPKEDYPETGVLVHRFMGLPQTGAGGTPPITGLIFNDHPGMIYGPYIADTSVGLNGYLSGHSVEYIEHVFDDYNHPPPSSPTYPDQIFQMPFGVGTPITAAQGCRFQHVYRQGDCSPDVDSFSNTELDLIGLAWLPIGGWVTNTMVEKMSIGVSYTDVAPNTEQSGGIPQNKNSGLDKAFKENILPYTQTIVVGKDDNGISYSIDYRNLFGPKNQGLQFNLFHPWPEFHTGFGYDSTKSLLIEYRMNPNQNSGLAQSNGFAYMAGIMSSMLPRFRVYSRGDETQYGPVYAATDPYSYKNAWGPLQTPGSYGDNSRYLMIFNYVKRISYIESPFLGPDLATGYDAYFLNPVIIPPLSTIPEGTALEVLFDSTPNPQTGFPLFPGVEARDVETLMNDGSAQDFNYMRFTSLFEANVEAGIVPSIDTVIVPFQRLKK